MASRGQRFDPACLHQNDYYSGKGFETLAVFVFRYLQEQENIAIIIKNEAFRER